MSPEQFVALIKSQGINAPAFKIATIPADYTSGLPTVIIDSEAEAGEKPYPYLNSYTPTAGDRVLIALVGHSGVIIGKIINS